MSRMVVGKTNAGAGRGVEVDPAARMYGWVFLKHCDGYWVSLRRATPEEMEAAHAVDAASDALAQLACSGDGYGYGDGSG